MNMPLSEELKRISQSEGPPTIDRHQYEVIQEKIKGVIDTVRMYAPAFSEDHRYQIAKIIGTVESSSTVSVTQIQKQYKILLKIQDQLLESNNVFVSGAQPKEISSMMTAMGSLLNSFMRHSDKLDEMEEMQKIKSALIDCIRDLPDEHKKNFMAQLGKYLEE